MEVIPTMKNAHRVFIAIALLTCFVNADAMAQMGAAHWDDGSDDFLGTRPLAWWAYLTVLGSFAFCIWICTKSEKVLWGQLVLYGSNALFIVGMAKIGSHLERNGTKFAEGKSDALMEGLLYLGCGLFFVYKALQKEPN